MIDPYVTKLEKLKKDFEYNSDRMTKSELKKFVLLALEGAIAREKAHQEIDSLLNSSNGICRICDDRVVLNDVANSGFVISIDKDEVGYYIEAEFDWEDVYSDDATYINYCPICGKKLEVTE